VEQEAGMAEAGAFLIGGAIRKERGLRVRVS
jgi:hypothetical protein